MCKAVTGLATFSIHIVVYIILFRRHGTTYLLKLGVWHLYRLIKKYLIRGMEHHYKQVLTAAKLK